MANSSRARTVRVGALVTVALVVLMTFLFFVGSEQKIFSRKNEYEVRLDTVFGLADGNPVKLSGVTIGVVRDIRLPRDPKEREVRIWLMIDRKYSELIRGDSRVRLKKLGLLAGDAYIEITPGTPKFDALEPGSIIPAQKQTNVDQLISSGEDLVDNFVQISYSLKNILSRVDRGEGLIGELTSVPESKQRLTDSFATALNRTNAILQHVQSGQGLAGRLIYDDKYAEELTASLSSAAHSLQYVANDMQKSFETGAGALPTLLADPEGKKKVVELVENLRLTSENLAAFGASLQKGEGLLPRLINDKQYGDKSLAEFMRLVQQLNDTVGKVNSGQGTAGKLISDPAVYDSINDILIGINESRLLRWLIRNRQERGIEQRYDMQQRAPSPPPKPPAESKSQVTPPNQTAPAAPKPAPAESSPPPVQPAASQQPTGTPSPAPSGSPANPGSQSDVAPAAAPPAETATAPPAASPASPPATPPARPTGS
jgi:phospholipid/cholesterol/gamma-HCH transport system substrate-binding protein